MKRSKYNKIIDEAIDLNYKSLVKIEEVLKDEKIVKHGGYDFERICEVSHHVTETISMLKSLKYEADDYEVKNIFALNNDNMFDDEADSEEEK